jgi:hypothetical protein
MVTISPRVSLAALERQVRNRVERDGLAVIAAAADDSRQVRYLRRLAYRLAGDTALDCYWGPGGEPDLDDEAPTGTVVLTVFARSGRSTRRGLGWFGEAHTG